MIVIPAATAVKKPLKSVVKRARCIDTANSEVIYDLIPPTVASPLWIRIPPLANAHAKKITTKAQTMKSGRRAW
jgi:hypothetical protein